MIAASGRAISAEILKLKRTLAFRMIFIAPVLVILLAFGAQWSQLTRGVGATPANLWDMFSRVSLGIWAVFMLPLLITLEAALLSGIEHGDKQWKHLFALPVRRESIFAAKYCVIQGLSLLSTLAVCGLIGVAGCLLVVFFPALRAAGPPAIGLILTRGLSCWLASGLIVSAHLWISLRWPSFALALGSGIAGTFFAVFATSAPIGKFYPWLLPFNSFNPLAPNRIATAFWLGIGGGLVMAIAACVDFVRREESAAPALGRRAIVAWVVIVAGFVALAFTFPKV